MAQENQNLVSGIWPTYHLSALRSLKQTCGYPSLHGENGHTLLQTTICPLLFVSLSSVHIGGLIYSKGGKTQGLNTPRLWNKDPVKLS